MTTPQRPSGAASEAVVVPLNVIIFFSVLNGMMFNVAVPDIAAEFSLLPSDVSWVITGYIVAFGIGSLTYGKLADLYPIKRLIIFGLVLFNAGSLIGYFSISYPQLLAARFIQAAGGSAIPALAMLTATRYLPAAVRGRVLGLIASTVAFAGGIGPIAGGFVAGAVGWRFLFLPTLTTLLFLPRLRRHLPDESPAARPFDFPGAILFSAAAALLLFGVTDGSLPALGAAALLLVVFAFYTRKRRDPFLSPRILGDRAFRAILLSTFLGIGTVFGMLFMTPIMLRDVNGLSSAAIGLAMFPGAMSAALLGPVGGRLIDRAGSAVVVLTGMSLLFAGFLLLSTFAGGPPLLAAALLIVAYAGFSFLQSSFPHAASTTLPPEEMGTGMGIYNLVFFISGAFSSAIIGRLLDRGAATCYNPLAACTEAWPYSNIFVLLALAVATAAAVFLSRGRGTGGA